MMDMMEIYKHARSSLLSIENRQLQLCMSCNDRTKYAEHRAKARDAETKRKWLEKIIAQWEG